MLQRCLGFLLLEAWCNWLKSFGIWYVVDQENTKVYCTNQLRKWQMTNITFTDASFFKFTLFLLKHLCRLQGRNEVGWRAGQEASLVPHVRTWGLSEAIVLYWRKYLWHCWDLSVPPAVIWGPHSNSSPGVLCPPYTPCYASGRWTWFHR